MTLWLILAGMLFVSIVFVVWPMLKRSSGVSVSILASVAAIAAIAAGLYYVQGSPNVPSGAGTAPDVHEMVASLAKRLEKEPDDVNGWHMLGRAYQELQQFDDAIAAYESAMRLEDGQKAQTLVTIALVHLERQGGGMTADASGLLENAVVIEPNNPSALFYSGLAAASRGDTTLAADRWELLQGLNAPPNIQVLLQEKIDEWRGVSTTAPGTNAAQFSDEIIVELAVSDAARNDFADEATVFIIARDPNQPSPPVAVARRQLSELPVNVRVSDRESMVPGRAVSNFAELEIVARISRSGQALQQPGDWFATATVDNRSAQSVAILINQRVSEND